MEFKEIENNINLISNLFKDGKIGVLPTDTIYGISSLAKNSLGVEKIYSVKNRDANKPFIILIDDVKDIENFGIDLSEQQTEMLNNVWPERLSIIFDLTREIEKMSYLHRGTNSLSFRIPKHPHLVNLAQAFVWG